MYWRNQNIAERCRSSRTDPNQLGDKARSTKFSFPTCSLFRLDPCLRSAACSLENSSSQHVTHYAIRCSYEASPGADNTLTGTSRIPRPRCAHIRHHPGRTVDGFPRNDDDTSHHVEVYIQLVSCSLSFSVAWNSIGPIFNAAAAAAKLHTISRKHNRNIDICVSSANEDIHNCCPYDL